jgi:Zn-finger nucleic acid-binding protein
MDITGRVPGYRGVAVRCPGCADPMTVEALEGADVDVCNACGGFWIDWFDGEIRAVAAETLAKNLVGRPSEPGSARNEARAIGACPRCSRQLVRERYAASSIVASDGGAPAVRTSTETGAELMRCEECAGAFVSRDSAALLATLPPEADPPSRADEGVAVLEPLPWQRLLAVLRRLLGLR